MSSTSEIVEIGLIGLGVMGASLALNFAENNGPIAVLNRSPGRTQTLLAEAGPLAANLVPCYTIDELVRSIAPPRPVIMMVEAGPAVDEQSKALAQRLSPGDILIDCGNSDFQDTQRRSAAFGGQGFQYLGVGVSGGKEGARHGPSIMAGGNATAWERVAAGFARVAAKFNGEPCCALLGPDGAGHFVKTIHNGIEYADMQMIAETYGIMRDGLGMAHAEMADVFARWNGGELKSYLIEITAKVLATMDPETGRPLVDVIVDSAGQKGTGRWAAIEAQKLGIPATTIEAAIAARNLSSMKDKRVEAERIFGAGARKFAGGASSSQLMGDLERALIAGKIIAYSQGFAVMREASAEHRWNVPLATVARIWRAGCIIRSVMLDEIAGAVSAEGDLLLAPVFARRLDATHASLRRIVAEAALAGIALPSLSAALAHFDYLRASRSTADLIQGQRDFFGSHGFRRIGDKSGAASHGPWN